MLNTNTQPKGYALPEKRAFVAEIESNFPSINGAVFTAHADNEKQARALIWDAVKIYSPQYKVSVKIV